MMINGVVNCRHKRIVHDEFMLSILHISANLKCIGKINMQVDKVSTNFKSCALSNYPGSRITFSNFFPLFNFDNY